MSVWGFYGLCSSEILNHTWLREVPSLCAKLCEQSTAKCVCVCAFVGLRVREFLCEIGEESCGERV